MNRRFTHITYCACLPLVPFLLAGCFMPVIEPGFEGVLVEKPLIFGHGGVDPVPVKTGRSMVAITTDLIVGFPGESEADFEATLALVEEVAFVDSFSFKYSPRPGTQAAALGDPLPEAEAQARLERVQRLQAGLRFADYRVRVGDQVEILVEGPSRRGGSQLRGRDFHHRLVNLQDGAGLAPG